MKLFSNYVLLFFFVVSNASALDEIEISPQKVNIWNNVSLETLEVLEEDLKQWCHQTYEINCSGYDVQSFISLDGTSIFYEFTLKYVDDVSAIYKISKNGSNQIYTKSWVSSWNHPLRKNGK